MTASQKLDFRSRLQPDCGIRGLLCDADGGGGRNPTTRTWSRRPWWSCFSGLFVDGSISVRASLCASPITEPDRASTRLRALLFLTTQTRPRGISFGKPRTSDVTANSTTSGSRGAHPSSMSGVELGASCISISTPRNTAVEDADSRKIHQIPTDSDAHLIPGLLGGSSSRTGGAENIEGQGSNRFHAIRMCSRN